MSTVRRTVRRTRRGFTPDRQHESHRPPPPPPPPTRLVRPPEWDLSWARADYLAGRIGLEEFERLADDAIRRGA